MVSKCTFLARFKLLIFSILFTITLYPQNLNKNLVKNSPLYYYGEAIEHDQQQAIDKALAKLVEDIAVRVQSDFTRIKTEEGEEIIEKVEDVLKTYSSASLKNVEKVVQHLGDNFEAYCYIEKTKVAKIFNTRKKLVSDLYLKAKEKEDENKYGYALKAYYFALILMNSIPEQSIYWNNINLSTEIPDQVNSIIDNLKFELIKDREISKQERELHLRITHENKICNNLEFSFWDGANQISVTAKDGKGVFRLVGPSVKFEKLDLSIKYSYYESRDEIKEVSELWDLVQKPPFKNKKKLGISEKKEQLMLNPFKPKISKIDSMINDASNEKFRLVLKNTDQCDVVENISKETLAFLSLIDNRDIKGIKNIYSHDTFLSNKIIDIIKYNDLKLTGEYFDADLNKTFEGWEVRTIPVLNSYSSIYKQSYETIILDFTNDGKLYNISYAIMDELYDKFVKLGERVDDWKNRQVIIKFVEKYRTAFLTRDIKTLESIFADEAVIIVGRILKTKKGDNKYADAYSKLSIDQPDVEYLRYSKDEYLNKQSRLFERYKDIFLGYSTFKINKKNNQDSVYGISMRQNYHSTNYADEGYLFLLVDFMEDYPQIYVRSWQPQEWDENSLIKLSNFRINR